MLLPFYYLFTSFLCSPVHLPATNYPRTWIYNFSFSATCGPLSWIIPAEIFDTKTRSKGVSISVMVSFAFNTMIGQVTPIAMDAIRYRYYFLFIICNFTNALFFYLLLPETAKKPLEEMNFLFTNAPWIVPGTDRAQYEADYAGDLEMRAHEIEGKDRGMGTGTQVEYAEKRA